MNDDDSLVTESPAATPNEDVVEESAEEASEEQQALPEETSEEVAEEVSEDESADESVEESAEPTPEVSTPPSACPVAATGFSAEAGNNEVTLSWSPSEVPEDDDRFTEPIAFYVSVSGPESKVLRTTDTALAVLGLRNGVEYSFEVFAATAAGRSAPVGPVRATPTTGMEGVVAGLIVEFADGVAPQAGATDIPGQERVNEVDLVVAEKVADDAVLVELSEPVDLDTAEKIAADLAADEQVEWAEPDQFFFTSSEDLAQTVSVPTDSQYASSQWNLWDSFGISVGDGSTTMTDAWAGPRGDGVTVAVIDTGITAHPDLNGQLVSGYDFVSNPEQLASSRQANAPPVAFDGDYVDEASYGALGRDANPTDPGDWRGVAPVRDSSWHGTKIAGLIAAASNADGITGIAPSAKIQPIRALSWRGGLLSDIAASITWASGGTIDGVPANANTSKVINMSFAVEAMCPVALQQAIDGALERGSILVAAAGNASDDAAKYAPGNCNGVITVAATNRDGNRADYSNYGDAIDIAAPGGDSANPITTTANNGTQTPGQPATATDSGTSIAAAHVSAAAAILLSRKTSITPSDAYAQLTGRDFTKAFNNEVCDSANPDYSCGTGILSLAQVTSGTCTKTEQVVSDYVFIAFTAPGGVTCTVTWEPPAAGVEADYLVVGGGGGGGAGRGGGGGAGGFIESDTPIDLEGPTTVKVGGGGVGGSNTPNNGTSGADSELGTDAVAEGGGYGAGWNSGSGGVGGDGGSGGGASGSGYGSFGGDPGAAAIPRNGGSGESGQGLSGGSNDPKSECPGWADTGSYYCTGGGGGGAASAGTSGSAYTDASVDYRKAGDGGAGKPAPTWLTASAQTALGIPSDYAGGGGGAGQFASRTPGGDGGTGGGGDGCGSGVCNGEPGTANTGGGGGGSEGDGSQAGNGGSGIVVIRYFNPIPQAPLNLTSISGTYGSSLALTTWGGSGSGAVTFVAVNGTASGCTVSGSSLSVTQAGTCLVTATKAGDRTYTSVSSTQTTVTFAKAAQAALSIDAPYTLEYGQTLALTTTGGSGTGAVTFSRTGSTGTARCLVVNAGASSRITGTNAGGTCTVSAEKAGDVNYNSVLVEQAFTVVQATQATLSMSSPSTAIYGQTISLAAIGGSGTGALSFAVTQTDSGSGECSISGTTLTLGDAGSLCKVRATKAASTNYLIATSAEQTIAITQAGQTVAFTSDVPETPERFGTYTPTATAISTVTGSSSGVTPSFSASGNCTIAGGVVTFGLPGTCTVTASAASSLPNYSAAANVTQTIVIGSTNQTIDFTQPSNVAFGSSSVAMSASTSSGGDVTFSLGAGTTNSACAVSSLGVVTILAVGTCEVIASAGAFDQYAAASDVTRAFQVVPALPTAPTVTSASASSQAITVGFNPPGFTGGVSISGYRLVATPTDSGSSVTSSACTSSPCTISGLTDGTPYTVTVAAINSAGTGPASSASTALTPASAAFAVINLYATPGDLFVDVNWDKPSNLGGGIFTRYDVYYKLADGGTYPGTAQVQISPSVAGDIDTAATTTRITPLDNGKSYDFKVVTITSANGSEIPGNTAEVVQYPSTVPTAPLAPVVLAATTTSVQFSWESPESDGGAALSATPYTVTVTGSAGAAPVTCTFAVATDTYCSASGLTMDASYVFSVVANNRMGPSPAASVTYAVPSDNATLSNLVVTGSAGAVALTPGFVAASVSYTASVANGVSSVTVTPTTTSASATVTVDGVAVVSGAASVPIALVVGTTTIRVLVTASNPGSTQTYTVAITRAAAPGGGGSVTPADRARVPVTPPAEVMSGSRPGAVLLDGQLDSSAAFAVNGTNSGWSVVDNAFALSARTESATGAPIPMTPQGVMQVPQGGLVVLAGSKFLPGTDLNLFAIPIDQSVSASLRGPLQVTPRSTSGAVYLGSVSVTSTGAASGSLTVPFTMSVGGYVLQINGVADDDQVASVNMLLDVVPGSISMRSALMREAAFYQGASAKFTAAGKAKLRAMVASIPAGAQDVEIAVAGVSVSLDTPRENLRLARDRAENIVQYLKDADVEGTVTISLTTSFDLQSFVRSKELPTIDKPMVSGKGKPLTTLSIGYEAPGT